MTGKPYIFKIILWQQKNTYKLQSDMKVLQVACKYQYIVSQQSSFRQTMQDDILLEVSVSTLGLFPCPVPVTTGDLLHF